jgi:hypothetical protein
VNIREMHYDLKQKLNKVDSQKYRNLRIPEIDWKLNEAQGIIIRTVAEPRFKNLLGFEINQRSTDDIRTVVVNQDTLAGMTPVLFDSKSYTIALPTDYWYLLSIDKMLASKGNCKSVEMESYHIIQHDDENEISPFDRSSFEWREINCRVNSAGLRAYVDGSFSIDKVWISYIRRPKFMHNAADYTSGTYNTLDGTALTGTQDSELPDTIHPAVVDLAVLLISMDYDMQNVERKQVKIKLTE